MYKIKKLKDCATIIAGQSPESKYYNTEGIGIPFFQGKADFGELYPTVRVYCSQPTKIAEKDDILLSVRAPVGPTNLSPGRVCIGRGLAAIRPFSDMSLRYLLYYFRFFESQLSAKGTGTTFKAITQATIKNLDVPVPPLPDQEHIVFRIEELFSQLDASVAELKTAKERLKVYRQAVLKEAFEGDYPQVQLKEISTAISGYAFKSKLYTSDGKYIVVKIGNVKERHFEFSRDLTRTNEADETILDKYLLQRGDCLITLTGSRGKRDYGFVTMIKDQTNYLLNQRVAAIRFNRKEAIPEFFQYYLASPSYRSAFFRYETGNVGQGNVGIKALTEPIVILPNIEQQWRIVEEIESRLSVCDSIEKTVDTALQQAKALQQSILKKAFKGGF
ncbi:restriction endonuclease subunit S [Flintibacter muris]|uniref:restriction endonuclease subunit S n=1 Tax=Flintibacter muris TaxID=2941327 RepID=UPI00203DDB0C|nr:restriction endonuclease subunit S [Flintibacter muris]